MKLIDTTDPGAHAGMRTLVSSGSAEREGRLAEKFRIHLVGMYFARVGREWDSGGRRQGDFLHHIDIGLSGRRQVVSDGKVFDLEPGQVWFLPGNTPVERRCSGSSEVLFFKFNSEWLPGVDPLLDWPGRGPRLAGMVEVGEWFEQDRPSPYMLIVAPVREEKRIAMTADQEKLFGIDKLNVPRSQVPSITHVDYSARIQTIHRETNPRYYRLIEAFEQKTGCPILINTSFNVRGEPIVCTPGDAYRCFMRTGMDYLVIENFVLAKTEQPAWDDDESWKEEFQLD